jgi:hypothetical protein
MPFVTDYENNDSIFLLYNNNYINRAIRQKIIDKWPYVEEFRNIFITIFGMYASTGYIQNIYENYNIQYIYDMSNRGYRRKFPPHHPIWGSNN